MSTIHSLADLRAACGRERGAPGDEGNADLLLIAAVAEVRGWTQDVLTPTILAVCCGDYRKVADIAGWEIDW